MIVWLWLLAALAPAPVQTGWAYHYHPYPDPWGRSMRQVAQRRGLPLTASVDGYASTPRCDHLGDNVLAAIAGQRVVLQQVDCSAPADLPHQRRVLDLVLETDFTLAAAQGWAARSYGGTGDGKAPAVVYGWSLGAYPCPESCRHPK